VIWNQIKTTICAPLAPDARFQAYLTRKPVPFTTPSGPDQRFWVIGPYEGLKELARALRVDATARAAFEDACFGRRATDLPPTGGQPAGGFRKSMAGATPNAVNPTLIAMRQGINPPHAPRRSDLFDVFADFYSKKTLEAHHIVEKSILGDLKRNKGDLRDDVAPCVLVVAELHQQIYTPEVSRFRAWFTAGMSSDSQAKLLTTIYNDLYASPQMASLLDIAKVIIGQVRLGMPK
jgi:hypothetical protein